MNKNQKLYVIPESISQFLQSTFEALGGSGFGIDMRATCRVAHQLDFQLDEEARALFTRWLSLRELTGLAQFSDLDSASLQNIRDHIEIMVPTENGAFQYGHYGEALAKISNLNLLGRSTSSLRPEAAEFFEHAYGLAAKTGQIIYAISGSALSTSVHAWKRFLFPFHDSQGNIACIVGLMRPTMERHLVWEAISRTAGFGAGSLEPFRSADGVIDDFLIIEAAGLAPLLNGREVDRLSQLLGRTLRPDLVTSLLTASKGNRVISETIVVQTEDGRRDLLVEVFSSDIGLILNTRDVTEIATAQRLVVRRTEQLKRAQTMGRLGGWSMNHKTNEIFWSPELIALLKLDPDTFVPTTKSINALYSEADCARAAEVHQRVLETGQSASLDVSAKRGDGVMGHYTLEFSPETGENGKIEGMFGTVQDITERKQAEIALEKLAYFDPLTGLPNRAMFKNELEKRVHSTLMTKQEFHVLLMDLDNFKDVNDTLGHGAGDQLLVRIARLLNQNAPSNAIIARLGGDEFAMIYPASPTNPSVEKLAETLIMAVAQPVLLDEGEVNVGVSIGIAKGMKDGVGVAELLKNADLALYSAKNGGRGRHCFFDLTMSGQAEARMSLSRDLKKALGDNALELHFQPLVALNARKVISFEALLRWRHPDRGYISPAEFIPIAESSGLICELGFWVLNRACQTMKQWIDAGNQPLTIAVNVSAVQFWQSNFDVDVMEVLEKTGLPAHLLKLEVTESVFVDSENKRVRDCFRNLAAQGIQLSIDDFGTGFSSLGYLSGLPFSELKIDRSFITGIDMAIDRQKLLQGIVGLARGMGMSTVVEGAETLGEVLMLQGLGCNIVQGFFFSKPQPFEAWAATIERIERNIEQPVDEANDRRVAA